MGMLAARPDRYAATVSRVVHQIFLRPLLAVNGLETVPVESRRAQTIHPVLGPNAGLDDGDICAVQPDVRDDRTGFTASRALRLSEVAHAVEFGVLAVLAYRLLCPTGARGAVPLGCGPAIYDGICSNR